jgi:hypothetical protein
MRRDVQKAMISFTSRLISQILFEKTDEPSSMSLEVTAVMRGSIAMTRKGQPMTDARSGSGRCHTEISIALRSSAVTCRAMPVRPFWRKTHLEDLPASGTAESVFHSDPQQSSPTTGLFRPGRVQGARLPIYLGVNPMNMTTQCNDHRLDTAPASVPGIHRRSGLSRAEEHELAARIANGDHEARNHMVRANLRLVSKIALAFRGRGLPLDDLIGEGNLGLIRAAQEFDPRIETRFSTRGHGPAWSDRRADRD